MPAKRTGYKNLEFQVTKRFSGEPVRATLQKTGPGSHVLVDFLIVNSPSYVGFHTHNRFIKANEINLTIANV